jgi:hypothetical protein
MLLLVFLLMLCHLVGDFSPLSTHWMLKAKSIGKPLVPIFLHASVHGTLMMTVLVFFTDIPTAFALMVFEIITHFLIDVWKGRMNVWFPALQDQKFYLHWTVFGIDQLLHQTVILLMVYYIFYP